MKKKMITFCMMASVILLSTSVATAVLTVDADGYGEGDNLKNEFWGVTLTAEGGGWSSAGSKIRAVDPTNKAKPFDPSTGDMAFGTADNQYPHLFWGGNTEDWLYFRADFSPLATEVSLDFIGNATDVGHEDIGVLYAYDASDNLLDFASTGPLMKDDDETLTVANVGGIAYILAYGAVKDTVSSHSLGLDNMQWEVIPAPGAILLGSIGIGLVGWLRRRRTL